MNVTKAEALVGKYREALLQKAFRGQLVPQNSNDEQASELLKRIRAERDNDSDGKKKKKDDLPPIKPEEIPFEIPKSWEWVRLAEVVDSFQNGLSKRQGVSGRDIPVLRLADIDGLQFATNSLRSIRLDTEEQKKYALLQNDLIVIRVNGSRHLVGKFISTENVFGMAFSDHLIRLRPVSGISSAFLGLLAEVPHCRSQIERTMVSSAGQNTISQGSIADLLVPLPPLNEQKRIVEKCKAAEAMVNHLVIGLKEHQSQIIGLRNSILAHAFSGSLVPQVSAEGTGHQLLEKIKLQGADADNRAVNKSKAKPKKRAKT